MVQRKKIPTGHRQQNIENRDTKAWNGQKRDQEERAEIMGEDGRAASEQWKKRTACLV